MTRDHHKLDYLAEVLVCWGHRNTFSLSSTDVARTRASACMHAHTQTYTHGVIEYLAKQSLMQVCGLNNDVTPILVQLLVVNNITQLVPLGNRLPTISHSHGQ